MTRDHEYTHALDDGESTKADVQRRCLMDEFRS